MSISDLSPENTIEGGTDGTSIGNEDDKLKVSASISSDGAASAFGELKVSQLEPYIGIDPTVSLNTRVVEMFTSGTGSAAGRVDNNPGREFSVSSGTDVGGYGVLRSKRTLTYRSGIGSLARFTARFDTEVANSVQRAGLFNIGNELTFGFDGTQFGILRKTGARPEIRTMSITTASNQSATATITLNGTGYNVSITNTTAEDNAYEIVTNYNWASVGWSAYNIDDTVIFQSRSTGAKSGTYSASVDTGNFAASFAQDLAGTDGSEIWTYQSNWNRTTLESAEDPFILDHQKGNVYQIQFQYLGYGAIKFYVENPDTGHFVLVHTIAYSNANTTPSLDLPTFKLGIIAASAGSTTDITVTTGSMAAFHEALEDPPKVISAVSGSINGVGTTLTNVLALKKVTVANGNFDITDVLLEEITAASEGTKPVIFDVLLNPTFADNVTWESTSSNTPIVSTSSGGTVSGGILLYSIGLSKSSNTEINLEHLHLILTNDDVIAIAARATSGNTDAVATIVWGGK